MSIALITLSVQGARVAQRLAARLPDSRVYAHARIELPDVPAEPAGGSADPDSPPAFSRDRKGASRAAAAPPTRFEHIVELTAELFGSCQGLVFIAPCGIVVRCVAPCLKHKTTDPPVVVVDVGGRWAISLVSGHEGGANELAASVAAILAGEPVITTTTEAAKTAVVGVGCRRGTSAEDILEAVRGALAMANVPVEQVRLLATADIKADEAGLLAAAARLAVPLRVVSSAEIRDCQRDFRRSHFVQDKVNLPAVAEPAALLAGRRTRLLLPKQIIKGVTVAVAVEDCT